jgi:hypothetical protein
MVVSQFVQGKEKRELLARFNIDQLRALIARTKPRSVRFAA